ncbi:MAG: 4-hydroxy-tetrahydrodipicolinate reductase [Gammaproteobacteria bacterium]|tara:strand:- start:743 stop:1483 length:741 start_codon:yes stop_codon:yes gene_type:complete
MSVSLLVSGITGKLGKVVAEEIDKLEEINIVGGLSSSSNKNLGHPLDSFLDTNSKIKLNSDLDEINSSVDVVLDVSSVENFDALTEYCFKNNLPLILASTGHSKDQIILLKEYSSKIPILIAPNLSIGINLFKKSLMVLKNNKLINSVNIKEIHHKEKKDSPSGTAKDLAHFIKNDLNLNIEIDIKSIRDDSSVGVHEVKFSLDNDEIIFTHNAVNRKIFAQGAVKAIEWIITQKPGFYSMQEISF